MPSSLYITLVSGKTVHVTDTWDGAEPARIGTVDAAGAPADGKGIEVGEYYRDIHRHEFEFTNGIVSPSGVGSGGIGSLPGVAIVPGSVAFSSLQGGQISGPPTLNITSPTVGASDLITHEKPRTWQKVCTWLVFTGTDGEFHWRASNVDGWSSQAPLD